MAFHTDFNIIEDQTTVPTTDSTVTNLASIHVYPNTVVSIEAYVSAIRTGGSSGTAGDGAGYKIFSTFKNPSDTGVVQIGALGDFIENEDQTGWTIDLTPSGGNVLLRVTGASNNNVNWGGYYRVIRIQ